MQRFSVASPGGSELPTDVVSYGADVAREDTLKLLGAVEGKRILDLGCGTGHNAIALARQGAKVIGVDESSDQVADARAACDREGVKVELHHAPLAELAFLRADTIDAALSVFGLAQVEDVDRVFRQVHRVLRPEMHLVLSLPHPAFAMLDAADPERRVHRSYWDTAPIAADGAGPPDVPRTISALFTSLGRANFRVDTVLEPEPGPRGPRSSRWVDAMQYVPATLIVRARKQGI
ncbi:MAG TPA: class I SAM-dependent methyltransferase [Acidimicrobiales bacterium]|nr:class I SAM-dependent methyltransferase [Acidimicrobiales bacterium]